MRLLDRILCFGFEVGQKDVIDEQVLENELNHSQLVVIDNVAEYFFSQRIQDFFTTADFPCVMLPFELSFLEFRFPKGRIETVCDEVGVSLAMCSPDDMRPLHPNIFGREEVVYCLTGYIFVRQHGSREAVLMAEYLLPVGIDGGIISPDNGKIHGVTYLFTPGISEEAKEYNLRFVHQIVNFPTCLALSFMHCRNVRVQEISPPPKLAKAHQRRRRRPLLTYHVLEIDHMKSVLEREGRASTSGLQKALHICRGHFATYGKDGKGLLFGKHSGRYWIPMHTRGSVEQGMVVKDYAVR